MKRFLFAALISAPSLAFAQNASVNGLDQRVPAMESQFLAQQMTEKSQQVARLAALLSLEQQDHKEAEERAAATKAWLDQAWKEMEYWRAQAGAHH